MKIGYEYAVYKFGDRYLDDPTAANIRARLNLAISGKMQSSCEKPPEASYAPEYLMSSLGKSSFIGAHYISIASTIHNELIAHVVLFFSPVSAFQVLLSKQANLYLENGQITEDFIDLTQKESQKV